MSYTVAVSNLGPATVDAIALDLDLPAGLLGASYAPSAGTFDEGPSGQVILQEYIRAPEPFITRVEMVGSDAPPDLFVSVDVNRDRLITTDEWHWSRASFNARDLDRNGRLTREEFAGVASQPVTSAAFKAGQARGLIEGRDAGREDKQLRNEWDLEGQRELEQADSGYDARFGPRAEYQAGYREAFRRGYREGFGQR